MVLQVLPKFYPSTPSPSNLSFNPSIRPTFCCSFTAASILCLHKKLKRRVIVDVIISKTVIRTNGIKECYAYSCSPLLFSFDFITIYNNVKGTRVVKSVSKHKAFAPGCCKVSKARALLFPPRLAFHSDSSCHAITL